MYTVYADDTILHDLQFEDDNYLLSGKSISQELNTPDSFSFTLPADHPKYDSANLLSSVITVYKGEIELFRGRILNSKKDFSGNKNVTCEGELAYLLDSIQRPYDYQGDIPPYFRQLISTHNDQVEAKKQFQVGAITVTDSNNYIHRSDTKYSNTWESITGRILDTHGGYIRSRVAGGVRYVDLLEDFGNYNEQVIEFGINLLSLEEHIDAGDIITALVPLGETINEETGEMLTIKSVNNNVDYIYDETAVSLFGWIWGTEEWQDVTRADNLLTKAKEFLQNNIEMAISINLTALDLNLIDVNIERFKLGDWIRVVSVPHGLDKYFQVSKLKIDLDNPGNSEVTLGVNFSSLTEQQAKQQKNVSAAVQSAGDANYAVSVAKAAASTASEAKTTVNETKTIVSGIEQDYVSRTDHNTLKSQVEQLETAYNDLEQRIEDLENA